MCPPHWIMRALWRSRCVLLLAYLSLLGLFTLRLAVDVDATTSAISGFVIIPEASGLRKRSGESESTLMSTISSSGQSHPKSNPAAAIVADSHDVSPYFDNATAVNVTAELGGVAFLHCHVRELGDKMVSWLRRRDFHILTVGHQTYSNDQRFQMVNKLHDWALQIKYAQRRDTGVYECQVNSDPPISHFVTLNVVVAKAEITSPSDSYFKSGSNITLTCLISESPKPPDIVFWYHEDRMINFDKDRGGITVVTTKQGAINSTLVITSALPSDSGNYTCAPSNAEATRVTVHVLNGEKPEAIQHDAKGSAVGKRQWATRGPLLILNVCFVFLFTTSWNSWPSSAR